MKKIIDELQHTFVVISGSSWRDNVRYHVEPKKYSVIIYDVFRKQVRKNFRRIEVIKKYISAYQKN